MTTESSENGAIRYEFMWIHRTDRYIVEYLLNHHHHRRRHVYLLNNKYKRTVTVNTMLNRNDKNKSTRN